MISMGFKRFLFLAIILCGYLSQTSVLLAQDSTTPPEQSTLDADQFVYDQTTDTINATGNVILIQQEKTLHADKITYNVKDDIAIAEGNISLIDADGDTHYADSLELSDSMRHGLVKHLYSVLEDGSRMWAVSAIRESPEKHVLKDARYTPCKACENNPDATPVWALRASKVTHNKDEGTLVYKNVRFEALGVPVLYTPYFSHADGSIPQKSGFLSPQVGFGSDYGFNFMTPYYWAISPTTDATIGMKLYSKSAPQLNLELRNRFENAEIRVAGSGTYSDRIDSVNGDNVYVDSEARGHFEMESLWNIDQNWRAGTDLFITSDEQYLEQYDISNKDILTNRIYAERFDDRDYSSVELLAFQDLRLDQSVDQPNALPYATMSFMGAPDSAAGGRFKWDTNFLTLFRDGNEQDMNRVVSSLSWQRRDVLPAGLTTRMDFSLRGDAYYTNDRYVAQIDPNESDSKFDTRAIPTANFEVAYPLQKRLDTAQIRVKPKVGFTARPNVNNDSDIPNEDSLDAQIDVTNLFEIDRFPGYDRVEDRTRVNYGIETGYYTLDGDQVTAQIGQSYRLDNKDNPFPNGSGFENQTSDIVGQIGAGFNNYRHNLNYRFQLDGKKLTAERHEIFGSTGNDKTRVSAIYLYERGSQGTEFTESREQIKGSISQKFDENWSVSGNALYDLGEDKGLRKSTVALAYDDDCFGITTAIQRELQNAATGADDLTLMFRFRLKNLGEFETAYDYGSSRDSGDDL